MAGEIIKRPESATALIRNIKKFTEQQSSSDQQTRFSRSSSFLQAAILFDTTGSMYPFFAQCKKHIAEIVKKVCEKSPRTQFSYVPYKNHDDEEKYFDGTNAFMATAFTSDPKQIECELTKIRNGGGGDGRTALECVFHYLNHNTKWLSNASKVVVLIGDMPPHGVVDSMSRCPNGRNYKEEVEQFKCSKIKVYSVFCFKEDNLDSQYVRKVKEFFEWIAKETGGKYLELAQIEEVVDLLIGVCMKETGHLDDFVKELKNKGLLVPGSPKHKIMLALSDGKL